MLFLFKNKVWLFLAFIRIAFSLFPQYGYIHPDEFFQTVEVASSMQIYF